MKWGNGLISIVISDKNYNSNLWNNSTTTIRLAVLYETECLAIRSRQENRISIAEMRMLRWMGDLFYVW